MRGSGFTPLGPTIMESGGPDGADRVVEIREHFQRVVAGRHKEA